MTEFRIPVSSQGQITLPKPVRERLGIKSGKPSRVTIHVRGDGAVVIEPEPTVDSLFGILKPASPVKPANIYEIREALVHERMRTLGYASKAD
ncbi:transcriptional regulator, AbrB family [Thermosinus carboxydivorans Nor1]|uniref:Transcriptional regulator, AbrB family n=1 Tax=Thermosinus carboxydivorans Nor1 TaxID=401526 RepID=A1HRH9_9FIRM|nr:AbrB/MazE/SpoVT family DNA-binding domain-containing protein [Thermosinus carboxydivorans]EAX47310.1 transcriptional regulator, AbrB family [Thermosinus carboxydivorans Nor1]